MGSPDQPPATRRHPTRPPGSASWRRRREPEVNEHRGARAGAAPARGPQLVRRTGRTQVFRAHFQAQRAPHERCPSLEFVHGQVDAGAEEPLQGALEPFAPQQRFDVACLAARMAEQRVVEAAGTAEDVPARAVHEELGTADQAGLEPRADFPPWIGLRSTKGSSAREREPAAPASAAVRSSRPIRAAGAIRSNIHDRCGRPEGSAGWAGCGGR